VHPFNCRDEINFLIELYNIRPFVRYLVIESADNDLHLKHIFRNRI
jgi:hypothetical protein